MFFLFLAPKFVAHVWHIYVSYSCSVRSLLTFHTLYFQKLAWCLIGMFVLYWMSFAKVTVCWMLLQPLLRKVLDIMCFQKNSLISDRCACSLLNVFCQGSWPLSAAATLEGCLLDWLEHVAPTVLLFAIWIQQFFSTLHNPLIIFLFDTNSFLIESMCSWFIFLLKP